MPMKIICTKENLVKALNAVGRIPKKDSTLPILNNVLIEAKENTIQILATDLEIGVRVMVRGKIEKEGSITIPAQLLSEYIHSLPSQNITLESQKEKLTIQSEQYESHLLGMKADEFPLIPQSQKGTTITLPASMLHKQLQKIVPLAANDETRPEITGVYLTADDKTTTLAATDGYRLAEASFSATTKTPIAGCIIPKQTLVELLRMIEGEGDITLEISESQVIFTFGDVYFVSRLIEGNYPSYHDLVPDAFSSTVRVNRKEFVSAVQATSVFTGHSVQDITVDVQDSDLKLSSEASQVGDSSAVIATQVDGSGSAITFNARYLLEGLNNFSSEEVVLSMNSSSEPAILGSDEEKDYFYLIMPIKHS